MPISPFTEFGATMRAPMPSQTTHAAERPGPITSLERVELIDAVRGFALFGVLIANLVWLTQDVPMTPERIAALPTASIDHIVKHAVTFFIDWKFITLFSFLFGLGFAVQLIRAEERGQQILGTYVRRLAILFVLGIVHLVVFWYGDILHFYAMLGFALILFRKASDRTLLILGVVFAIAVPAIAHWLVTQRPPTPPVPGAPPGAEIRLQAFLSGDPIRIARENVNKIVTTFWVSGVFVFILSQVFGKFLLGYVAGRRRLLQDAAEHLNLYRNLLWWGLIVGLLGNGVWILTDVLIGAEQLAPQSAWMLPARLLIYIGTIALAAFYLSAIVLLYQRECWRRRINLLAPVGRMALSNYLMHTVFYLLIFYGYGLGLLGKVGTTYCVIFGHAIFAVQIAYSGWWLRRFRFGPAEWLWRALTYGKAPAMRYK
jgi:uncharacterized protein